jgi:hypothetical protein
MRGKRCSFAHESFAVILCAAMASPREAITESKDPVSAIEGFTGCPSCQNKMRIASDRVASIAEWNSDNLVVPA